LRPHWRFEDLEIWQRACQLAVNFHQLAERLNERRLYRYSEQLRAAGLSLSNNIAEGSGSTHPQEFIQFLNIARRSLFENVSMLLVFEKLGVLASRETDKLLTDRDALSRKITAFTHFLNQKKEASRSGKR
jgi:four helix bundle protein